MNTFYQIRSSRVCTCALWIIGEYATSQEQVEAAIEVIKVGEGAGRVWLVPPTSCCQRPRTWPSTARTALCKPLALCVPPTIHSLGLARCPSTARKKMPRTRQAPASR